MVDETNYGDVEAKYLSRFAAALQTHDPEQVSELNKPEAAFYISEVLDVEMPDEHPSQHNSNIRTDTVSKWAVMLADYVERNGTDALQNDGALSVIDDDDGDDESEGSEETNDSDENGDN